MEVHGMAFNFRKVRIGFVNLILSFLEGQDKAVRMSKAIITYLSSALGVEVVEFEEPVGARKQATAAWKKFNAQDVDAVILFSGTFNTGELTAEILRNMSCPFAIWGVGELSLETKSFTGSVVGVMPAGAIFKSFDRPFTSIYGAIDDREVQRRIAIFVHAVRAIAYLRESAIGVIGMRPDGFQVAGYDELAIKKLFGTEIKNLSLYTLSKVVNAVDEKQVDADMEIQRKIFDISKEYDQQARGLSKVYLGLKKAVKDYDVQSYAPDCWPEFRDNDQRPFCPANGRMNADGIMASCECDVDGSLTLMVLHAMQQDTPWFADLVDIRAEHNALFFWHCGNAPYSLSTHRPKIEKVFGGPSQINDMRAGTATVCRINHTRSGGFLIHAGVGEVIEHEPLLKGSNLLIRMKGGNREYVDSMLDNGIPHHNALIYGDLRDELREYARLMKVPIVIKD
jgi:L-fucose isomerase-like protein